MGLTGGKSDSYSAPKPTLYQWIREAKIKKYPVETKVDVIWLPNRWPNYTIDTTLFRLRISEDSSLFKAFSELLETYMKEGIPMQVSVLDEEGNWDIDRIPDKQTTWEKISTTGVKMKKVEKLWVPSNKTSSKE